MTNVLVPIDGSSYCKVITDFLVNHRWAKGTQFRLCHVIEPLADDFYTEASWEKNVQVAADKLLHDTSKKITTLLPSVKVTQVMRRGIPDEEILEEAANWPADLIVLGSHSHHDPHKTRLGSVALSVLGKTKSTVIIVRVPPEKIKEMSLQADHENLRARYKYCDAHT
ncbi:MAG: universal stress protein [Cyanobacteria bacterium SZAS-4]|nr:universal stress protein [Cyanobacteria bacterium SZAS-4]